MITKNSSMLHFSDSAPLPWAYLHPDNLSAFEKKDDTVFYHFISESLSFFQWLLHQNMSTQTIQLNIYINYCACMLQYTNGE